MSRISDAMKHPNVLGAGARKREHLKPKEKMKAVMKEYKRGTLHSGSGDIVKNRGQAVAIGMSESGLGNNNVKKR